MKSTGRDEMHEAMRCRANGAEGENNRSILPVSDHRQHYKTIGISYDGTGSVKRSDRLPFRVPRMGQWGRGLGCQPSVELLSAFLPP